MGIAAFTATSLARPLHTLQRWWQQLSPALVPCRGNAQGAAQTDPCAVSVLTLRRARNTASIAAGSWHAAASTLPNPVHPSAKALALPAFRRLNHRDCPRHSSSSARLDALKPEKPACALPTLRVLHRPASLARPGCLVIAGRMAEVCAELDRLVALETVH